MLFYTCNTGIGFCSYICVEGVCGIEFIDELAHGCKMFETPWCKGTACWHVWLRLTDGVILQSWMHRVCCLSHYVAWTPPEASLVPDKFLVAHKYWTFALENNVQLGKIGLTMQLNEPKERPRICRMESWAILEGNLIPIYARFLRTWRGVQWQVLMVLQCLGSFLSKIPTMEMGILWIRSPYK